LVRDPPPRVTASNHGANSTPGFWCVCHRLVNFTAAGLRHEVADPTVKLLISKPPRDLVHLLNLI